MNKRESLRDYFRRARTDAGVRAHLIATAKYSRSVFGWVAFVFAILAVWQSVYLVVRSGVWLSGAATFYAIGFVVNMLIYDKFGDRITMLASLDDVPNHVPDPTLASCTSPAGQETRHR